MPVTFSFSPRPNRAGEIRWSEWGPEPFRLAAEEDRPVMLQLTAAWCHWCHVMDETTLSHPDIIDLVNGRFVPIRVDADRLPHVRDRYIAGGWPTTAFLTPEGEVLWSGTSLERGEFMRVAEGVLVGWSDRREDLLDEVSRRRMAMETTGRRRSGSALVRREAADSVMAVLQDSVDPRNGGFGEPPRFPAPDAVELLLVQGVAQENPDWVGAAEVTLDGMLAGEMYDHVDGGFHRYALEADWTDPQYEKLLHVNAGLARVYALAGVLRDRADWRDVASRTVAWVDGTLGREDGLWNASQNSDEEYYGLDGAARADRSPPRVDPTVYTDANAAWIRSLADAGGRMGRPEWIDRSAAGLTALVESSRTDDGSPLHVAGDGADPNPAGLLTDCVELARACTAVAQASGEERWLERAETIAAGLRRQLRDDDGTFRDAPEAAPTLGALRYPERPFDLNADAARLFLDLALARDDRTPRAVTERILAVLSSSAARHGAAAAGFAMAVEAFFEPPLQIVVVGEPEPARALRHAALALPLPDRRVWPLPSGGSLGGRRFPAEPAPAAYVCGRRGCSSPVTDVEELAAAVESVR